MKSPQKHLQQCYRRGSQDASTKGNAPYALDAANESPLYLPVAKAADKTTKPINATKNQGYPANDL